MRTVPSTALLLHRGCTVHKRFVPFVSAFRYRIAMVDLDIDRLDEASDQCRLFSVEKRSLFSFRRRDHGAMADRDLRPWAESAFREAGLDIREGKIRLITFARHLYYKFAPISLWLGFDKQGELAGILYEVRNTFGERHVYTAALDTGHGSHVAPKSFHVSPFFDVTGDYEFRLRYSGDELSLGITTLKNGRPIHRASLSTTSMIATDRSFLKTALFMPFSALGVTLGIHWEALKLWIKGARFHRKPAKVDEGATLAVPSSDNHLGG